ncbi:hypothetical protein E8E15_000162, partial [Penicillium rubens]
QVLGSELLALTHDSSNKISAAAILGSDDLRDQSEREPFAHRGIPAPIWGNHQSFRE